jgi:hypothetical protein
MQIKLERYVFTDTFTIGKMYIDGNFECYTIEDTDRFLEEEYINKLEKAVKTGKKVYGKTAIPKGTYRISITFSPKYQRMLPLLENVPGFSGIRIHSGNSAKDTDGCILPGVSADTEKGYVHESRKAFLRLFDKMVSAGNSGKNIMIEIV